MLPATGVYAETYSLTALARIAERRLADPNHRDLWEGLKATFLILQNGEPRIGVFPYNGQLFDLRRTARLMEQSCENRSLLKALKSLTQVTIEGFRQRINVWVDKQTQRLLVGTVDQHEKKTSNV